MNKVQDGFFSFKDSHRPLVVSPNMRHSATVNFVENEIIIRPARGCLLLSGGEHVTEISFYIEPAEVAKGDVTEAVRKSIAEASDPDTAGEKVRKDAA